MQERPGPVILTDEAFLVLYFELGGSFGSSVRGAAAGRGGKLMRTGGGAWTVFDGGRCPAREARTINERTSSYGADIAERFGCARLRPLVQARSCTYHRQLPRPQRLLQQPQQQQIRHWDEVDRAVWWTPCCGERVPCGAVACCGWMPPKSTHQGSTRPHFLIIHHLPATRKEPACYKQS